MSGRTDSTTGRDHQPALDGVRGLAVAIVLLFHGGFAWMSGGYVGVSVFFTLSGFLITGLLLREHRDTGRVSLSRFFVRRLRRLLPASLACLAAISVAAAFGAFEGAAHLRRDVLAALLQVANWNALAGGTSYADLVAHTTGVLGPVDHFWSLSVEEQFYWVWPLAVVVSVRYLRTAAARRNAIVAIAALAVAAAPVIAAVWGADAAYWATPARLGEILVGAAMAAVMTGRSWRGRWLPWAGLAGLAVVVHAAVAWPADRGPAYSGWLGVFALASVALIAGLQVEGPLRRVFSVRPLAHLGRISYGVYLYHWPLFALLTPQHTGWAGWWLFSVRLAATLAVAEVSYALLEQPIRRGQGAPGSVARRAVLAMSGVAVLAVVAAPSSSLAAVGGDADVPATFAPDTSAVPTSTSTTLAATPPTDSTVAPVDEPTTVAVTTTVDTSPLRVLVLGDSTAEFVAGGLHDWAGVQQQPTVQVASLAQPGCGFVRDAAMFGDVDGHFGRDCADVLDHTLPATLAAQHPEVVVAMVTLPDVLERTWSEAEGPLRPTDPRFRERLIADVDAMVVSLLDAGVTHVVWVVGPPPSERAAQNFVYTITDDDWSAYVSAVSEVVDAHADHLDLVRLDRWMAEHEPDDGSMRPDGVHLTPEAARRVVDAVVGPVVLDRR